MSTIVTRAGKGSALTHNEVDANFVNLNTDKLEASTTSTLTNKTINLTSNTLTGTTAQFNTALSDGDFATLAGTETLTNKTITSPTITGAALNGSLGATTPSTVVATTVTINGSGANIPLEIQSSTGANAIRIKGRVSDGIGTVRFYESTSTTSYGIIQATSTYFTLGTEIATPITFQTNATERMRLDSSGNLGLGVSTITGGYKAQINGNLLLSSTSPLVVGNSTLTLLGDNTSATGLVINTAGNLGLGVTTSAWIAGYKAQQIGGSLSIASSTGTGYEFIVSNGYIGTGDVFKYINTGYAAAYRLNNGTGIHAWYNAPSGTAGNNITFTQAMTLDASGNLLVGSGASSNTTLNVWLSSTTAYSATNIAGYRGIHVSNDGSAGFSNLVLNAVDATGAANCTTAINAISETSGSRNSALTFMTREHTTGNIVERARIDSSGTMLVGTTGNATVGGIAIIPNANNSLVRIGHSSASGNTAYYMNYFWNGNQIGSIQQSGTTGVTYVTSSDYRLKENVTPIVGALARVALLKPVTYSWIGTDGEVGEGFIAHELQEVCPLAAMGEKDAVNEDGTIKPQGIDPSKLVATLTAAIQEQQAMIDELKAKVAALEAA
jgi:hypothetical protein